VNINEILELAVEQGVSDIHITVGRPPVFRKNGSVSPVQGFAVLMPDDTRDLVTQVMSEEQFEQFQTSGELDLAYSVAGLGRFRVNTFHQRGSMAMALRRINSQILALEQLGMPPVVKELSRRPNGLVLVTGPTGSGKSTTLAAIIDMINRERAAHIITLEDPVEYIHQHHKCIVNQREIGADSKSFTAALRSAMRQDPDVILVGELRDLDTIAIAITAAETGHLVLGTLHTNNAAQTVDRIIDVFPPYQQSQIRVQLAETLRGVIAQQLVPKIGGGRVASVEILVATPGVRNIIREGKSHQLMHALQTGGQYGMQTMDSHLKKLMQSGLISSDDMYARLSSGTATML